jgi:hypothetical protein
MVSPQIASSGNGNHILLLDHRTVVNAIATSTTISTLNFLIMFPTIVFNVENFPPPEGLHLPLPNFSAFQSFEFEPELLNLGNVADIFLFCLEKKPSFLVVKLGVFLTC